MSEKEQAAEAREWAQYLDNQGGIRDPTTARHLFGMADAVDVLSVRLAQAEQERDEANRWRDSWHDEAKAAIATASQFEQERNNADALKREYEEALTAIQAVGKHSRTVPSLQRIARDALAASGERSDTAEAGGREAPDTKEPDE